MGVNFYSFESFTDFGFTYSFKKINEIRKKLHIRRNAPQSMNWHIGIGKPKNNNDSIERLITHNKLELL